MSERTESITEDVKVIDCDVCKKEAPESMLCHACHRDFCVEHQEGGDAIPKGDHGMEECWYCSNCVTGAQIVYTRNYLRYDAAKEQAQKDWTAFRIEQQGKHRLE